MKRNQGITLVALIITIIILLILAGITINLTVGQRGILARAQEAGKNYQEVAKREDEQLENFLKESNEIIGNGSAGGNGQDSENPWESDPNDPDWSKVSTNSQKDNYEDELGKKAVIPEGFQVSKKEGEMLIDEGLVIREAVTKNEYVWVPCTADGANGSIKYDRTSATNFAEEMPIIQGTKTELDSIKVYGGFYIGRYEVGIIGYTKLDTNNSSSSIKWTGYSNGTAVVQKGKQVWNYITRDKAKEIAEGMYSNNSAVISRLCSSYAWDTTLKFIETKHVGYSRRSIQGNYKDTTFTYTDLNGTTKTKVENVPMMVPTGQTTPVNNIYDMGGNASEFTSESGTNKPWIYSHRGGHYDGVFGDHPARYRNSSDISVNDKEGFRQTLFVDL